MLKTILLVSLLYWPGISFSSELNADFLFKKSPELNFRTKSPDDFIWSKVEEKVTDFEPSEAFSSFEQDYVGYDPLNRDKLEIRIYSAEIEPYRIMLPYLYADLFAREWQTGEVKLDSSGGRKFGDALTEYSQYGDDRTERISVYMRNDKLLIFRMIVQKSDYVKYEPMISAFIKSVEFSEPVSDQFLAENSTEHSISGQNEDLFRFKLTKNWNQIEANPGDTSNAVFKFYQDISDKEKISFLMMSFWTGLEEEYTESSLVSELTKCTLSSLDAGVEAGTEYTYYLGDAVVDHEDKSKHEIRIRAPFKFELEGFNYTMGVFTIFTKKGGLVSCNVQSYPESDEQYVIATKNHGLSNLLWSSEPALDYLQQIGISDQSKPSSSSSMSILEDWDRE